MMLSPPAKSRSIAGLVINITCLDQNASNAPRCGFRQRLQFDTVVHCELIARSLTLFFS
jgi:hypothetical protein